MKTPIQKLSSSKLFYKKWPYKIECTIRGASRITRHNLANIKAWCNNEKGAPALSGPGFDNANKKEFLAFINLVEPYLNRSDLRIRTEGSHFNIFCMDLALVEDIESKLRHWIRKISGPTSKEELEFLLSNGHKKILRDSLPKSKFRYRIYFKNRFPEDKRLQFTAWTEKYQEKIEISGTSKRWLTGERKYAQDPFMYVEDDKMLSLIGMYISGHVKKVEEFILRDTVLTA